jgi:hypothetical protein
MPAPPKKSIPERDLFPDVRVLLNRRPELVDHSERLAAALAASEHEILDCLTALEVDGEVLS